MLQSHQFCHPVNTCPSFSVFPRLGLSLDTWSPPSALFLRDKLFSSYGALYLKERYIFLSSFIFGVWYLFSNKVSLPSKSTVSGLRC